MEQVRVIVIDDSAFMRKMVADILESDSRIKVIATARNGADGIDKIKKLSPDVVTLDVHMPVMDGMDALQQIMQVHPVPVVMLSSVTKEGTMKTIQAISNGAVDFIKKPSGSISLDIREIEEEIISKVITASMVDLENRKSEKLTSDRLQKASVRNKFEKTVIAIGTSTGGPRALQKVLTHLPATFAAPILIVQHMPAGFTKSLADRLDLMCAIRVKEAEHGEIIEKGVAYIAPGDHHMTAKNVGTSLVIYLTKEPPVKGHRPAVDILFNSMALLKQINKIPIILTGMGNDGTEGIINLKETDPGTLVIAESEETSIVYGMPKAAIKTSYVDYVLPLYEVADIMMEWTKKT
ncbi:protein-glutamate methylesterase/protein-glutamine glutaminase [Oceanobacillus massiliensis]|uniref:protein-glutamate methylesterase/protein-glutamine glutaminase n=1 Tax=Oceanobacillus massiliensis TaxID=1465765 RepID=UPI000287D559|nr:chemotaxis response regulator protein-glutamate methylesterase [Oceanobacillus massiliensis]